MPDIFDDVEEFHIKYGLDSQEPPTPQLYVCEEMMTFRTGFLCEEAEEHADAARAGDLVKTVDANLDAIYVAVGNLRMLGVGPVLARKLWDLVHQRGNLKKVRAERADQSLRGTAFDVVKPPGWVSPEPAMRELLREHGAIV